MAYLFYLAGAMTLQRPEPAEPSSCRYTLWRPSLTRLVPYEGARIRTLVWWLFHHAHIFANRDYCVLLVHQGDQLVHHALISPRYFRFPFMEREDLQVGDVWTAPSRRRCGIASAALRHIVMALARPGRRFWYVTTEDNLPSQRTAEKAGFCRVGEGTRSVRWGLRLFGQYRLITPER